MGGMGMIFTPVLVRHLLGPLGSFRRVTGIHRKREQERKTGTGIFKIVSIHQILHQ